jgi:hypothetical protein
MADMQLATLKGMDLAGRSAITPSRVSNGISNSAWLGIDGAMVGMAWQDALALEGRVFTMTVGTLSTGIVGGGNGTVPVLAEPEFMVAVPAGAVIKPLRIAVQGVCADAVANHNKLEIIIAADILKGWDLTGTATTETPLNFRTDLPRGSACAARSAFTVAITSAPAAVMDLARREVFIEQTTAVGTVPIIVDLLYEPVAGPFITGPAMLFGMWGGTSAVTGYAQVTWAEWSKTELGF